ncbi:MAG: pyrroloquinoline quinone-dependent dehydrogenase [Acidobacteriaceae bacterium]|nr:pyrroloquinoline quinone-dependent dehydrogenase [Acidobacteriaceae bacterium]
MWGRVKRGSLLGFAVLIAAWGQKGAWTHYGADASGTRYSALRQITPENISRLQVRWIYHTRALEPKSPSNEKAAFEATPILVNGLLYLSTPFDQVIALNPETGEELWRFDPQIDRSKNYSEVTSRGVAAWRGRIFVGTIDARLIALDGKTGKPCSDFGRDGHVDLTDGIRVRDRGDYQVTSAPTIAGNLVIIGSSIGDNRAVDVEQGVVRAYDASNGKLRWTWDPISWAANTTPRTGAANAWSTLAVDEQRHLVYVPTGSASPDFYGGLRPGDNRWANSVLALDANTGEMVWGFQVVHHDLWDYDVASQPSLFTWGTTPAIAISTKMGHLFVLNRVTGKPLLPVEERKVPKSDVPLEETSATQPFPLNDALVPARLTAADAWGATEADRKWCEDRIKALRNAGIFTPPSLEGSIAFPGNIGGVNWGSAAVDSARGILVANTNRLATTLRLIPRDQYVSESTKARQNRVAGEFGRQTGAPFAIYRESLLSPHRLPCNAPPWGTVTAIDLKSGKKLWDTPLGSLIPGKAYGSINLGGPIIAGDVVFTAAAMDTFLRAFDLQSGREIWRGELPASAQATPMTYISGGKQFVVVCAGGHAKLGTKMGDAVVAFTLP